MALIVMGVSACHPLVIASVGEDKEVYRGSISVGAFHRGELTVSNSKGRVCSGKYQYLNPDLIGYISLAGIATLRCNDGMTANMRFRTITKTKGWGTGKTSTGEKISFTYGMNETDARMYLDLPEKSLDVDTGDSSSEGPPVSKPQPAPAKEITQLGLGSGLFINDQGHILTNNHVVDGCEHVRIALPDGTQQQAEVLFTDSINDLAVLKVSYKPTSFATFAATSTYRQGDDVVVFGFSLGNESSKSGVLAAGTIAALSGYEGDGRFLQVNGQIQNGNNSGILSDKMGNVIGINARVIDPMGSYRTNGMIAEDVGFSVKDLVIKTFLKAHAIAYTEINKTQVLSNSDVGDLMRRYSVKPVCYGYAKQSK